MGNAVGKPSEDTADLSLRDSLMGRSLKAAGEGEAAAGKSALAARKRPKPTLPLCRCPSFGGGEAAARPSAQWLPRATARGTLTIHMLPDIFLRVISV